MWPGTVLDSLSDDRPELSANSPEEALEALRNGDVQTLRVC